MPPSDLLHEALNRHAASSASSDPQQQQQSRGRFSPPFLSNLSLSDAPPSMSAGAHSEDDLILVQTPLPSRSSSPAPSHPASRSTSPNRSSSSPSASSSTLARPRSGAGKPRRDKTLEQSKERANKASRDPLTRLPNELSARCFGGLDVDDLLCCGRVCKRWKNSQTINYTWYNLLQSITYTQAPATPSAPTTAASALLLWTRRDSKIDWSARFASVFRRDDLEDPEGDDRDEDGLTMKEERELKWKEEKEGQEAEKVDKVAMRAYYKSLRNSKVKGKTGKGAERTWEGDGVGENI